MKTSVQKKPVFHDWLTYQKTEIILQATKYFCNRFYHKYDPVARAMLHSAGCARLNIEAAGQAEKFEPELRIKLLGSARQELEALRTCYKEFLRMRAFSCWGLYHPEIIKFRRIGRRRGADYQSFRWQIENPNPEVCVNFILNKIRTTIYLLKRQREAMIRSMT